MNDEDFTDEQLQALREGEVPAGYELVTFPESQRRGLRDTDEGLMVNFGPLFERHGLMTFIVPETDSQAVE